MKRRILKLFIFNTVLLVSGSLFAQDYNDAFRVSELGLGSNARALGMGNAYTAVSDDFSAASYNPAGFGLLKRMEFAGGINYSNYKNNAEFFGQKTDYSNSQTKLDQFSFAFPFPVIRGSLVVAVGYSRDKDFNNALSFNGFNPGNSSMIQALSGKNDASYYLYLTDANGNTPISGQLQQSGTVLSSGGIGKWSFSGATEVSRNVFVGGSLNIYNGDFKRTREYYEDDVKQVYGNSVLTDPDKATTADFRTFYLNDIIDWDITGWDAKIGLLYQAGRYAHFGASIKFPTSYTIKEKYTETGRSEFGTGASYTIDPVIEDNVEYDITTPFIFTGGGSVNYHGLVASVDLSFIDYTQMEYDNSDSDGGLAAEKIAKNNRDIKELFSGVMNFNAGLEYRIPETDLRVRGGFILNPSPFKDDPSDFDKKYITTGIGFLANEAFAFDVAYAHGWWKDLGDNYSSGVSRTYQDISYNNLIFTVSYRF